MNDFKKGDIAYLRKSYGIKEVRIVSNSINQSYYQVCLSKQFKQYAKYHERNLLKKPTDKQKAEQIRLDKQMEKAEFELLKFKEYHVC